MSKIKHLERQLSKPYNKTTNARDTFLQIRKKQMLRDEITRLSVKVKGK